MPHAAQIVSTGYVITTTLILNHHHEAGAYKIGMASNVPSVLGM